MLDESQPVVSVCMDNVLARLGRVIEERKGAAPGSSYVASLYSKGIDAILKKIGEEATELVIAGKSDSTESIVHEAADLWFHTLVLLAARGLGPEAVLRELEHRFGLSGLQEKANRPG